MGWQNICPGPFFVVDMQEKLGHHLWPPCSHRSFLCLCSITCIDLSFPRPELLIKSIIVEIHPFSDFIKSSRLLVNGHPMDSPRKMITSPIKYQLPLGTIFLSRLIDQHQIRFASYHKLDKPSNFKYKYGVESIVVALRSDKCPWQRQRSCAKSFCTL